jgi:hypothetical protein
MKEKWYLKTTNNINQMLRLRDYSNTEDFINDFPNLLIVKHNFHIADDIMFPDPSCLAFFTAFENSHLEDLEEKGELKLFAVDICEGLMQFFIYCNEPQKTVYDCISFLKSNNLYKCEFEIIRNDKANRLKTLSKI